MTDEFEGEVLVNGLTEEEQEAYFDMIEAENAEAAALYGPRF